MGKLKDNIYNSFRLMIIILVGGIIIFFVMYEYEVYQRNNVTTEVSKGDIVLTSFTGEVILIESKYFWGGVWFNKDKLIVSYDKFEIEKNSLIFDKKTIQLPVSKIKKVNFEKDIYDVYKISIWSEDGFYYFYIKNKDNFEIVKSKIIDISIKRFVVESSTD